MASISSSIHASMETPLPAPSLAASQFKFQTGGRGRQTIPISKSPAKIVSLSLTPYKHRQQYIQNFKVSAISEMSSSAQSIEPDYLVRKVSGKELNDLLTSDRTTPLVVDFYATWCGPCLLLAQQLELLAVECGDKATIVKIDTDEEYELARQLEIRGLPTVIFISPDPKKHAVRIEGVVPNETMKNIIENEL